jgi:hypothetical protein
MNPLVFKKNILPGTPAGYFINPHSILSINLKIARGSNNLYLTTPVEFDSLC